MYLLCSFVYQIFFHNYKKPLNQSGGGEPTPKETRAKKSCKLPVSRRCFYTIIRFKLSCCKGLRPRRSRYECDYHSAIHPGKGRYDCRYSKKHREYSTGTIRSIAALKDGFHIVSTNGGIRIAQSNMSHRECFSFFSAISARRSHSTTRNSSSVCFSNAS